MTVATSGPLLLVEDDPDLRMTVAELLRDHGLEVAEAGNGLEAIAWMNAHPNPALIVLDLMMPKMDGLQFRAVQLADPSWARVPVVLMTASTVGQSVLEATGAAAVIRKPVTADELFSVMNRVLAG